MFIGTYSIDVWCEGRAVSDNPFSSEVYDTSAVVVSTVNDYSVGEPVDFESKCISVDNLARFHLYINVTLCTRGATG